MSDKKSSPGALATGHGFSPRNPLLGAALAGLTVAAAFGAPAMADDIDSDATVTVVGQRIARATSPKATAPLKDTPQTVSVIPSGVFDQQGARNLTDVLNNTPGITFNAGENGFATGLSNFSMRGFDTSGNIFSDGVRDSGSYNRDAFNTEQVEVFKGPAGDNGRGGAGGYVNVVTKTPRLDDFARATVSYGFDDYDSDGRVRATLDANHKIADATALRLNLLLEDGGVPGRALASVKSFGFAPSFTTGLGTDKRLTLAAQYVRQEDLPDWGLPGAFFKGTVNYDSAVGGKSLRDVSYGLSNDHDDVTSNVLLARYEQTLSPNLELSTQLRWSNTDRDAVFTMPSNYAAGTQQVTTLRQAYARENQTVSWLTNLSSRFNTGALRHRASFGVELSDEKAVAYAFATQTNPGGGTQPAANPNPNRAAAFANAPTERSRVLVSTLAAYAYDTVELSEHWQLTGGLRVEKYKVKIGSRNAAGLGVSANGVNISETTYSGRLGLVYKPVESTSFYASYGVSAQPPASFLSNSDISRGGDNGFPGYNTGMNSEDAKTQKSVNYEIGAKWASAQDNLNLTAALFRTERQNVAISGRPTVTAPVELMGYGEQIVQGLELGLTGKITPKWDVFAGVLWLESERSHSAALDLGRCRANPADFGAANAAACDATHKTNGDELAFTPEWSGNVWTSYKLTDRITLGGGARYVGDSVVGRPDDAERIIPNGRNGELPGYWTANLMAEYDVNRNVSVRLNVDNVADKFYAQSLNWSVQRGTPGAARSALLTLVLRK
ncbi:TonB-dependent receptor [Asticcacaulis tiandongensis]|uniref:TonB-dependent receptor n=1 Tax=Asticcacaulis tiandongensis TaxID=2565365 RepID=UPI00112AB73C|nr:TonB-dependent receptor [Asticcacaulis tiandongensis]